MDRLKVKCYSGQTYAEEPRSFEWEGAEYELEMIEKVWREPGRKYFQLKTRDSKIFRLCYNEVSGEWSPTEMVRS